MSAPDAEAKAIFLAALDHESPDDLACYLDTACGADIALRARVEELLAAHRNAGNFLGGTTDDRPESTGERTETVLGPYKLLEQIGEGGFGVVFLAEQQRPVRRTVALKVLKPGMDTRQVIARFEAERQALALMDHPNIAKVLDGGETASGRPYFVMDLVKGVAITQYCDHHHFTPRQRLKLLIPVCQAIQHAHQKGIIHRDIKPSNVLVAAYDGEPVPKVIDFGIAKALGQRLTDRTLATGFGGIVGTLEYMSPEQAEFNALDVDTRADIYSLGVVLYELLTGTTPLSRERLRQTPMTEALRLIREEEPPKPSTRLSDSQDTLASISAQRQLEPARLARELRGELDWIVMKCLEKDRSRRYETCSALARDLERYLNEEPVEACPPSAAYRLRKFVRKNRKWLTAAGAFALVLLAATGVSIGFAVKAMAAEKRATTALDGEAAQREQARAVLEATGTVGPDGRNETIDYLVPNNQGGTFYILLTGEDDTQGEYFLDKTVLPPAEIHGRKFDDLSGNGVEDACVTSGREIFIGVGESRRRWVKRRRKPVKWEAVMFRDRGDAAQQLAAKLKSRALHDPLVLAIPRGGVVTGAVLARELGAELDVVLSRKLRAPDQPELAVGAIAEDGTVYMNHLAEEALGLTEAYLDVERRHQLAEITRRRKLFRTARPQAPVAERSVIVTDDGIATGSTMIAALQAVKSQGPREVIVAVPVASPDRLRQVRRWCDEVVCLLTPENFWAIGQFYEDFTQVEDEEVVALLRESERRPGKREEDRQTPLAAR